MGKVTKKTRKKGAGRPLFGKKTVVSVLANLDQAFAIGCTDKEACGYADISLDALYRYERKHEAFRNRKQLLKEKPILQARTTVVKGLENDKEFSLKFLERKKRHEFSPHSTVIIDDGKGVLTEERKLEIAGALANWNKQFKGDKKEEKTK